jgi:signal transduction histidine kinase
MKKIKLLTLTTWNYLGIFLVLILFFFGLFYFITRQEVLNSIDEVLYNRKMHVLDRLTKNHGELTPELLAYDDLRITTLTDKQMGKDQYADTIIYEWVDNEWDEFRKLTSFAAVNDKNFKFEIVIARIETHEIVSSILKSLLAMTVLMVIAFYFASRYLSQRIWSPFYGILDKLNGFRIEKDESIDLPANRIEEFDKLGNVIQDLTTRSRKSFLNQKEFIENASHEMQTPLAVTQSKLDLLISDPQLTEAQAALLQGLMNAAQRMARLNRTLILLSKIENHQFPETEAVALALVVEDVISNFEDSMTAKEIVAVVSIPKEFRVKVNKQLLEVLLTNLIKNAIVHNRQGGQLLISLNGRVLSITNTSDGGEIPAGQMFKRFYKQSNNSESWGLGLAMVKKICEINGWSVRYHYQDGQHSFQIMF